MSETLKVRWTDEGENLEVTVGDVKFKVGHALAKRLAIKLFDMLTVGQ